MPTAEEAEAEAEDLRKISADSWGEDVDYDDEDAYDPFEFGDDAVDEEEDDQTSN